MPTFFPKVGPEQVHGIELDEYAHELATATVWIGYIQWLRDNGFGRPPEPILKSLETVTQMDAVLTFDGQHHPVEPEWPEADVIVGNPPFLGGKRMRKELGDEYVDALFSVYLNRVPREADLVCYWFEKARAQVQRNKGKRAGLGEALARLEHDRDSLMESYAGMVGETLEDLAPEEHHRIYKLLRLGVRFRPDWPLEITGVFAEVGEVGEMGSSNRKPSTERLQTTCGRI